MSNLKKELFYRDRKPTSDTEDENWLLETVHLASVMRHSTKTPPQGVPRSSRRFTWGEEEAVGEVAGLAVGGAALTVIGRHSGVNSDALTTGGDLRHRSHVLLRDTDTKHRTGECVCVRVPPVSSCIL